MPSVTNHKPGSLDRILVIDDMPIIPPGRYRAKEKIRRTQGHVYSSNYDPVIIEKMTEAGIYAYVHKYESIEEIRRTYARLARGESYISDILHTLYFEYGQGVRK